MTKTFDEITNALQEASFKEINTVEDLGFDIEFLDDFEEGEEQLREPKRMRSNF
jgi:predicted DNA-binding protein